MGTGVRAEIFMALAWLLFPMLPAMFEEVYYLIFVNLFGLETVGPEPRDWGWWTWLIMLGPLLGYGFVAGATADVPDDATRTMKGLRRIVGRRAVWVAIGPWWGFLVVLAIFLGLGILSSYLPHQAQVQVAPGPQKVTLVEAVLSWAWTAICVGIVAYGWLWPAWAAVRRAGRIGLWRRAVCRGVVTALAFVGSLFGSFWAITSAWRGYFFDPRGVIPLILAAIGLAVMSGCSSPITYGEMRRRELFHAMLLAWVAGMAMIWWWSSRRRRKGPR
jgi:hypothetical protein